MSIQRKARVSTSSSSQSSQSKRKRLNLFDDKISDGLESDLVPKSCLTEEDIQRVVRKQLELVESCIVKQFREELELVESRIVKQIREELEVVKPNLAGLVESRIRNTLTEELIPKICSSLEDTSRRVVREELEHVSSQSAQLVRSSGKCRRKAKTEAFTVKEHRGESYKKHYPPASDDEIWRLANIAKDGSSHKRLNEAGIYKVEEFVRQLSMDSKKLRNILGKGMTDKKFSLQQKDYADRLVKKAYENWNDVRQFDAEASSSSISEKISCSFLSEALGDQQCCHPVHDNMPPPRLASQVGLKIPPRSSASTVEGMRSNCL
ncbi:hypothetical protein NL676_007946 [Syzygium grande]|nr:hypothetical protein NL676_007946 [Syzygium grande]